MLETYTPEQQIAVEEKIELFRGLKEGRLEDGEWSDRLHQIKNKVWRKRTEWVKNNFEQLRERLKGYKTPVEKAFRLVFFEYMGIEPEEVELEFFPNRKRAKAVFIRSKNFCPYLAAFNELELDPACYCELVLEKSVEKMANEFLLNPEQDNKTGVIFGRNYHDVSDMMALGWTGAGIRPYEEECQEFFIDLSLFLHHPVQYRAIRKMYERNLKIPYKEAKKIVTYWP
jgi:ferredoxin-thioredoxin reductase catalytic subunit